jgi:glycosyltransferase involved in cell wall biosynthesis/ADP-heptose:LPS heptosyltransferase/SAM-dependent methyltransferase
MEHHFQNSTVTPPGSLAPTQATPLCETCALFLANLAHASHPKFLVAAYRFFLQRVQDESGYNLNLIRLYRGLDRAQLVDEFIASREFRQLQLRGVPLPKLPPPAPAEPLVSRASLEQYQDIWLKGKLHRRGIRECEERFGLIRDFCQQFKRPFTILDLGANLGYFSLRLTETCDCTALACEGMYGDWIEEVLAKNENPRVILVRKTFKLNDLRGLAEVEHFDVVLALSVIHHLDGSFDECLEVLRSLGDHLILELPFEANACGQTLVQAAVKATLPADAIQMGLGKSHLAEGYRKIVRLSRPKTQIVKSYMGTGLTNLSLTIRSNFAEKVVEYHNRTEQRPWHRGVNLQTYLWFNGRHPSRSQIADLLENCALPGKAHRDIQPWNIVLQGDAVQFIDCDDPNHASSFDDQSYLKRLLLLLRADKLAGGSTIGSVVADGPPPQIVRARENLKVAEDYAQEKDLTKIDGDSEFARAIRQLFKRYQPRRIIETGTYLGTGTTRVIAETIRALGLSGATFHSIEINPGHFARARANLRAAGLESFVRLERGLSVPRQLLPDVNQIEDSTVRQPEFGGIFVDHREANRAKLYFAETNFSDCPDDLLGRVLGAFENQPDFVLLDSGGHMGFVEFQYLIGKLAGPCLIGLDDIHHIKHHKSFQLMRRDPRFEVLVESKEKFGFCLARFTPTAVTVEPDHSVKRLLWVRTDSIGDAVLASAMLEPIRKKYPQANLAVLCQQRVASLYTACPFVDLIICYDRQKMLPGGERQQIMDEISAFAPEVILNSVRSRDRLSDELTLAFAKARHIAIESDLDNISAAGRDAFRHRYEQIIASPDAPRTELERHAGFLRGLGIETSNLKPVVWNLPADEALAEAFFKQQELDPAQTIAVFPGAQFQMRVYHHYANALKNLEGFRFLIFGDATQNPLAENLERQLPSRTVSVCGRTTLGETVALLRRCRLYVGAESAGAHIACAVGVPNVVVLGGGHFGRFMPYSPLTTAVVLPLDCFGCNWQCPYDRTRCITNLAPDVVAAAITAALQGPRLKPVIVAQTSSDATLPPALAARLAPGAVDFIAVAAQPISPLRTLNAAEQIRSFEQLIHLLDQGTEETRKLSQQLRIIAWQYQGWENYHHERAGSAEAEAAVLIAQLAPQFLPRLAPLNEIDGRTALALGLAGEIQKDWPSARACYSHALLRPSGGILGFRLAVRLARLAAKGGDSAMSDALKTQVIPKLRATLPPGLNPDVEEQAVLDWPIPPPGSASAGSRAPSSAKAPAAPLVTAIVSTFKSERFIRGCLEDLEAQTISDRLEIVVVDSHSPQNERAIVEEFQKRYSNIVYIRTEDRETVYGAWNRGARAARGKYLTNANTDDRHRPDALEILARTLEENPEVSLAYADCLITPNENETYYTANPEGVFIWLEFNARDLWSQGCFAGPQPMWRREVHQEHGFFDAEMTSAGDYEFWLRLAQNRKFLHVRATLGLYLKSPTSVEHANREVGAREAQVARQRYRDSIMAGKPPFRPKLSEPTVKVEIMLGGGSPPTLAQAAAPKNMPAVARLGQLDEARELFAQRDWAAAWAATLTAIGKRPFHPEAYLLLAEIALASGAGKAAKQCAQRARDFAPGWSAVKQFLCRPLKGEAKPEWLVLPKTLGKQLSVCLIVKNEEKFLAQCLKSVRGFATQLIVVDTGSTDRTVEIAREFGAEIHFFAWCDDFAAARNAALEHATGDWVLMLDADEELLGAQHAKLLADMKNPNTIAYRLPLVNASQEIEGRSFVPRLFRNAPGASFTGRIHEQVFSSLLANAKKWGLKMALGSAELRHHGYTKDLVQDRNKVERNLKLLRAAIEENPADVNLQMNLGLELVRSDDLSAGVEKYRHAYDLMSAQRPDELVPELREVLLTQFTSQLYKVRAHEEVVQVLHSRLAQHGGLTASLHFALGLAHFELKQFSEAADQMRQCLAKRKQLGLTPINTDILTAAPPHCLALCLARLGDLPAAEKAFVAALAETGHVEAAKLDYAQFLLNGNRHLDALHQLNSLVAADPRHLAAWRLGGEIALVRPEFLEFALDWTAEAVQALPANPVMAAQRAEALMLNRHASEALPLWEKIWNSEHEPRTLAALILCEIATDRPAHAPNVGDDERATSLAFVEWYQKLIAARAKPLLDEINARVDALARTLPAAAEMLQAALSEAAAPLAVG